MAIGELLFLAREVERLEEKLKTTELELRKEKKKSEVLRNQRNKYLSLYFEKMQFGSNHFAYNRHEKEIEAEVDKVV